MLLSLQSIQLTTSRQSVLIRLIANHRQSSRRSEMLHYILLSCLILSSFFYVSLALLSNTLTLSSHSHPPYFPYLFSSPLKFHYFNFQHHFPSFFFTSLPIPFLINSDSFYSTSAHIHITLTHPYPSIHALTLKHQSLHLSGTGTVHGS